MKSQIAHTFLPLPLPTFIDIFLTQEAFMNYWLIMEKSSIRPLFPNGSFKILILKNGI
jgi:hypothetical protein